jgi:hypothetical protein
MSLVIEQYASVEQVVNRYFSLYIQPEEAKMQKSNENRLLILTHQTVKSSVPGGEYDQPNTVTTPNSSYHLNRIRDINYYLMTDDERHDYHMITGANYDY